MHLHKIVTSTPTTYVHTYVSRYLFHFGKEIIEHKELQREDKIKMKQNLFQVTLVWQGGLNVIKER